VNVVLEHDLHAERGMPGERADEQQQEHRVDAARHPGAHGLMVGGRQVHDREREPDRERHERDGGQPLHPPMRDARLGGTAAERTTDRAAQTHRGTPAKNAA
jgi:hypothetical protein